MKKRTICVVTGSRAEYGHLFWLMKAIQSDPSLKLQVVVTGAHLSKKYGSTYKIIEKDRFNITRKVDILKYPNTDEGITKSMGLGTALFARVLADLMPDIIVVCGDRYEILAAVIAAYVAKLPVAHIHGGETSEGAIDEAFRHSITKMSQIHFASTEIYRRRIIQLGENPKTVFNFGAPGLDNLYKSKLLNKQQLAKELKFDLEGVVGLVTYHPVTLEKESPEKQVNELLKAIQEFDFKCIFTKANADSGGMMINQKIKAFCLKNPRKYLFVDNLGKLYPSCLKNVDVMIGNSSSGIVESPSFKLPTVNVGDRQKGRLKALNVIDVAMKKENIVRAIHAALSRVFRQKILKIRNPYLKAEKGNVSFLIKEKLKHMDLSADILKKTFFDVKFNSDFVPPKGGQNPSPKPIGGAQD